MSFSDSRDPNWYTDTGASARMTADAGNLKKNMTLFFTLGPLVRVLFYVFFILMMPLFSFYFELEFNLISVFQLVNLLRIILAPLSSHRLDS